MRRFTELLLRYRLLSLVILLAITGAFASTFPRAVLATDLVKLFFAADSEFDEYLQQVAMFSNDTVLFVTYDTTQPLALDELDALQAVVDEMSGFVSVRRVTSLLDAARLRAVDGGLETEPYVQLARDNPGQADQILADMLADRRVNRVLLSADGKTAAIMVESDPEFREGTAEGAVVLIDWIHEAMERHGFAADRVHLDGMAATAAAIVSVARDNLLKLFPFVVLCLFIAGWILFRQLVPVLLALGVAQIADIWAIGMALLIDPNLNIMISIVPTIILVVAFSDVVHLCSAYLLELAAGKDKQQAILDSCSEVGAACVFTSITTFFGFIAIAFVPTPVMRQMGIVLGFGVAATLLIAVTLVPIVLSFLPQPRSPVRAAAGHRPDPIGMLLKMMEQVATGYPRWIVGFFAIVVAVSVYGATRLKIDVAWSDMFEPDFPARQEMDYVRDRFAGTSLLSVVVDGGEPDFFLEPDNIEKLDELTQVLKADDRVDDTLGLPGLMAEIHDAMSLGTAATRLPENRQQVAQYLLLFSFNEGADLDRIVTPDYAATQVMVRLYDDSFDGMYNVGQLAVAEGRKILGPDVSVDPGGIVYFMGGWLDSFVQGQKNGFGFAVASITLMMILGLRSVRVGVLSMAPNLIPLLVFGGYLGLTQVTTLSDNFTAAMIAIGIAVDDTIHFLMRYRLESRRSESDTEAMHRAFYYTGRAMVITSIILFVGFAPLAAADMVAFVILGLAVPSTIAVALFADLLLIPAMVQLGWISFKKDVVPLFED